MKNNIFIELFIWVLGTIVALTVGSGMIEKTLTILGIPEVITFIAGWVVVIGTILSAILVVFIK
ncbi:MAG: hypothetical protein ABIH79_02935 [archaeon]